MSGMRPMLWLVVAVIPWLVVAGTAHAQPARNSVERNRVAMCAKADADGDSYRPFVCDARCDCMTPESISLVTSCTETVAGAFEAKQIDSGTCGGVCSWPFGQNGGTCTNATSLPCDGPEDCPAGELCGVLTPSVCFIPCTTDAGCAGGTVPRHCENSPLWICASDADCASGTVCAERFSPPGFFCEPVECSNDSDCDLPLVKLALTGVSTADGIVHGRGSAISTRIVDDQFEGRPRMHRPDRGRPRTALHTGSLKEGQMTQRCIGIGPTPMRPENTLFGPEICPRFVASKEEKPQ